MSGSIELGLAATQRWMQAVILGETAELDRATDPASIVEGDAALPAVARLELYRRSYVLRLRSCLRDAYPALRHALGDELFDDFADEYVASHPSYARSLGELGAGLPEHLDATRPDAGLAPLRRERWPDFLVDLARLEWAFCEVYDGPGDEERKAADEGDDDGCGGESKSVAGCRPSRCLRLLELRYPADDYMLRVRRGDSPALPRPEACSVALGRRDYVVTVTRIAPAERRLLELVADARFVASDTLLKMAHEAGFAAEQLSARLRQWCEAGLLVSIDQNEEGAVRR